MTESGIAPRECSLGMNSVPPLYSNVPKKKKKKKKVVKKKKKNKKNCRRVCMHLTYGG